MILKSPRRLVQRIAWTTFAAITASAIFVACVSGLLADRFAKQQEEDLLTNAASVLAAELVEPGVDPLFIAADEARELKPTNIRVAVYEDSRLFAGDAELPSPGGAHCITKNSFISCGVTNERFLAVAARDTNLLRAQRLSTIVSSLLAALVTALLGALFARSIALKLISPLTRLSSALERVPADTPERAYLGDNEGLEEIDALRETLRTTFIRLGHSFATTRRFAADAAHELRTPLTVIIGQLELNERNLRGVAQEANERARRTAARLSLLLDRLLVLATPATKLHLTEELEIHSAIDDAMDLISTDLWPRIHIISDAESYVRGDQVLLAALITNAIENGLKFSDGEVEVRLRATDHTVELSISDQGPGIPESERERVFEPFFRTRATRASGTRGHGLGLSLIAHVSAVHGGTAYFEARPRGTCLKVTLPRCR